MLPAKFVERVLRELGPDEGGALCRALTGEPSVSVRLNAAKGLAAPSGRPIGWSSGGYWLDARPSFTLDPDFHAGRYYVQEASSQFVGHIVAACGGIRGGRVLDLCAAPGGKTTLYSTLAGRGGLVVANEIVRNRAAVLADNVRKWGVGNVAVTVNDPSQVARLEGWFDAVAVDAPCSGEGMFRKLEEARTEWSEAGVALCAERQRGILREAWRTLRPGGLLLYSTCTFNFTENEGVLRDFSVWAAGETEPAERIAVDPAWGVVCGAEGDFQTFRFYPHKVEGEGFFAAAVRKRAAGGARRGGRRRARRRRRAHQQRQDRRATLLRDRRSWTAALPLHLQRHERPPSGNEHRIYLPEEMDGRPGQADRIARRAQPLDDLLQGPVRPRTHGLHRFLPPSIDYFMQPSTRNLGFSVKVTF